MKLQELINKHPKINANINYFRQDCQISDYTIVGENAVIRGVSDRKWVFFIAEKESGFLKLLPFITQEDQYRCV